MRPEADAFARLKSEDGQSMAYVFFDDGRASRGALLLPERAGDPRGSGHRLGVRQPRRMVLGDRSPRIPIARSVSQGEAVKRPSTLFLNVEWQESNPRIFVGGDVIELGRGTLDL